MKKEEVNTQEAAIRKMRLERPPRAKLSEEEVLKRMKEFYKRKEQFLAAARACKS
ncbi:MAG TPA: hypothetical protein VJ875_12145 [Pyrinomonadaceae bacterium]|nr:hypothetical protein [Pyrinomonadaceae bacterium]